MSWSESYEGLRAYLRDFTNSGGGPAYDCNGILMLLMALVENLRECPQAEAELPELAEGISAEQAEFLEQLALWAKARTSV